MITYPWQIDTPLDAIVFDCDGTLSSLEGIDELARSNGVGEAVEKLTADAMSKHGMSLDLTRDRLNLVQPRLEQVIALGQRYFQHQIPDVHAVIQLLHRLHKTVYIVSAGLHPAVTVFGGLLNVPHERIYAIPVHFDEQGAYSGFEHNTPLTHRTGKREIITQLKTEHPRIMHIGDGLNDHVVYDLVTRFIGFGGAFYRENIAAQCEYYIKATTMAPLLPLALTLGEYQQLTDDEKRLFQKGLDTIHANHVLIQPS